MRSLLFIFLLFVYKAGKSQTFMKVKDQGKIDQIRSIEFLQWKFSPESYYYSWYYEDILLWDVKIPGLGIHENGPGGTGIGGDNYVHRFNNNYKQYVPAIASVVINRKDAEEQEIITTSTYNKELAKFADREVDYSYPLIKSRIEDLILEFFTHYIAYESKNSMYSDGEKNCEILLFEYQRIQSNIEIIRDSHLSNADRRESYLESEEELRSLVSLTTRLNRVSKNLNFRENE